MLNAQSIIANTKAECGTELSKQAIAVINAICKEINQMQVLENHSENETQPKYRHENSAEHKSNGHMKRPALEDVILHGEKIGLPKNECEGFHSFYEANGWKVGRNPMKLWTAAMSNWKRTWLERNPRFQATEEVSFREVKNLCREKWGDQMQWMSWASSFYNYWAKRKWMKPDGTKIDWRKELSQQVNKWRK